VYTDRASRRKDRTNKTQGRRPIRANQEGIQPKTAVEGETTKHNARERSDKSGAEKGSEFSPNRARTRPDEPCNEAPYTDGSGRTQKARKREDVHPREAQSGANSAMEAIREGP